MLSAAGPFDHVFEIGFDLSNIVNYASMGVTPQGQIYLPYFYVLDSQ